MNKLYFAVLALALGGCTNLEAVSTLSGNLVKASGAWNDVGQDIKGSCERQQQFNAQQTCADQALAAARIVAVNKVLSDYFNALHDVANNSNFTVQPGLTDLAKSAAAIPGAQKAQIEAASGLAGALAKLATEALREDTLRRLIQDHASEAKSVISLLQSAAPAALKIELDGEARVMKAQFRTYIRTAGDDFPETLCDRPPQAGGFHGQGFLLALEYCRRLDAITVKQKALADYTASLANASKALDDLDSAKTRLGAKELIGQLYKTGKDLDDKVVAVQAAFSKGKAA
jgi:hypothetical protein